MALVLILIWSYLIYAVLYLNVFIFPFLGAYFWNFSNGLIAWIIAWNRWTKIFHHWSAYNVGIPYLPWNLSFLKFRYYCKFSRLSERFLFSYVLDQYCKMYNSNNNNMVELWNRPYYIVTTNMHIYNIDLDLGEIDTHSHAYQLSIALAP